MCDLDCPTLYEVGIIKTRKVHRCIECRRIIKKGEQAEKFDGLYEKEWQHYYTCEECFALRSFIEQNFTQIVDIVESVYTGDTYGDFYGFGELEEFLSASGLTWEDEEILEEIDSFELLNYDPNKSIPMGKFCLISTKVPWLKIVEGRYRLNYEEGAKWKL
ncbi:MAG: hypothetical protein F6K31_26135 [Symploca sp. SIO2G7]|nr:hypothetical protein [Symploca sp. SIO2G7]